MKFKKHVLAMGITSALLAAPLAQADTVLGIYAGAGMWKSDYSGDAGAVSINIDQLGLKEENNEYYYVALEHPVPIIPNIRLYHTALETTGLGTISQDFTLDNQTFTTNTEVATDLDLTHTDATLYYEVLDNWINLDFGLTLRKYDGNITAVDTSGTLASETVDINETLPLLYAKVQFDLPFTGWAVGAYGNFISYDGNSLSDVSASLMYSFESAVDLGFEVGFRRTALELDDTSDLQSDITIDGLFAGVTMHF